MENSNLTELIDLHLQAASSYLIKKDLFGTNPTFPIITPFNSENKYGYFTYAIGRDSFRYSRLYDKFEAGKVKYGYTLEKTNSLILICRSIKLFRNDSSGGEFKNLDSHIDLSQLKKYCVFQDPFSKTAEKGALDILKDFDTINGASQYAEDILRNENVSTLVAFIKDKIVW